MNSKRKLWTNIGSLALVAVLAVGGVIGVLSALNVQISSTFSISYTAHNVHAIITGSYYQSSSKTTTTIPGSPITFLGDETGEPEKSFSKVGNLTIPTATDYINMFYTIKNTSDTPFGATLNFVATTSTNMKITYCTQYWDGEAETLPSSTELNYTSNSLPAMYLYGNQSNKNKSAIVIGVHVEVDNVVQNASLDAHVDFDLSSQAEDPNKPINLAVTGEELGKKLREGGKFHHVDDAQFGHENTFETSYYDIIFDYYTADGIYSINGRNVIESVQPEVIQEGIKMYKVPRQEDAETYNLYILSNSTINANQNMSHFSSSTENDSSFGENTCLYFNNFNTTNTTDMSYMFSSYVMLYDESLSEMNTCDICISKIVFGNGWNTSNVTNMRFMFNCAVAELDLSSFNTGRVTDMTAMFFGCHNLKAIYVGDGWDTRNVHNEDYWWQEMFGCEPDWGGGPRDEFCCSQLVGGSGTTMSILKEKDFYEYTDIKYACVDEGPDSAHPGYFTHIRDKKN